MFQRLTAVAVVSLTLGLASSISAEADQITLSETQVMRLGVRNGVVRQASEQALVVVPGSITAPLDARLTVAAPFAGTVMSIQTLEGTEVKAGDPLLTITSNDYLAAQARHAQAQADYRALKASAERLKTLSQEGVVAAARAEAAEAEALRAKAELDVTKRLLDQVKPVSGQNGVYSLVAPKSATIAQLEVMPGDMVDTLDGTVVLEDAGTLWVEAELPARFLGQVTAGDVVRLEPSGIKGEIIAIGRRVDPQSRSVTVRAKLETTDGLKPGQSLQATIFGAVQAGSLSVPRDAVVRLDGDEVVFLMTAGGYQAVPVTVLSRGADDAIVMGALPQGAEVAVSALTELKALALEGK